MCGIRRRGVGSSLDIFASMLTIQHRLNRFWKLGVLRGCRCLISLSVSVPCVPSRQRVMGTGQHPLIEIVRVLPVVTLKSA